MGNCSVYFCSLNSKEAQFEDWLAQIDVYIPVKCSGKVGAPSSFLSSSGELLLSQKTYSCKVSFVMPSDDVTNTIIVTVSNSSSPTTCTGEVVQKMNKYGGLRPPPCQPTAHSIFLHSSLMATSCFYSYHQCCGTKDQCWC